MNLDLTDESLQRINQKLSKLVELQAHGQIGFGDTDLDTEDIDKQVENYLSRRKQGYRNLENPEDDDIRQGVRDFLKKRAVYRTEKDTRDLTITKPNF